MMMAKDREAKVVFLGDASVGKSSIILRFVSNTFKDKAQATIGSAFMTKTITNKQRNIKFMIWDTAGSEKYHSLAPMSIYFRGAAAAIIAFDITNSSSFTAAKIWLQEAKVNGLEDVILVMAGNKCDLESRRSVSRQEAEDYAKREKIHYFETSAKDNTNISTMFNEIADVLPDESARPSIRLDLKNGEELQKKKRKCC